MTKIDSLPVSRWPFSDVPHDCIEKFFISIKSCTRAQKYGHAHKNLDTHAKIWTRTQKFGYARKNMDTHAKIWTRTQKYGHTRENIDTQKFKVHKNLRCAQI